MCGVCGVVRWSDGEQSLSRVLRMRGLLEHRGPDGIGAVEEGPVVLGATRLAVRGGHEGQQPLRDPGSGVVLVCNGEIDNHDALREWLRSRGRAPADGSDVAILPDLYLEKGEDIASELDGPFALAVWDPRKGQLLLARDRVGERPLFYLVRDDEVLFATELSALAGELGPAPALDNGALAHYLRFGRFAAPASPFRAVRKVAPSEVILFRRGEHSSRRYWHWPIGERSGSGPPSLEAFDEIFRSAVRRQTECDVEFGLFLSGGVDSSLVAAVARSLHPERLLRAYTVRFDEPSYDESAAAGEVAALLGLEPTVVRVEARDFPSKIRELVRLVGEPLADPAWVPTALLAKRAAEDVKVVLVGEGGDEVFGGYPTYVGALLSRSYERLPPGIRRAFASVVEKWPPSDRKVTLSFLLKRFVQGDGMAPLARHLLWTSTIAPAVLERLGVAPVPPFLPPQPQRPQRPLQNGELPSSLDVLDVIQGYDLESYLAEGLLTKADRASMGWALEPRAPFLDRGVLELAATLSPRDRVHGLQTKAFLKRYALRYLPKAVVYRRKKGLSVPLSGWLRGPLREWASERLGSGRLAAAGVETKAAVELLEEHSRRRHDHGRALWSLLVLVEWLEWTGELRAVRSGVIEETLATTPSATGSTRT
jgi:asparagine synthase (glutamine-hydrolysing)